MPSPFPGMDPFLEHRDIWPGFHADLAVQLKHHLNRQMSSAYYADIEIQSVLENTELDISHTIRPDVSVFETPTYAMEPPAGVLVLEPVIEAPVLRLARLPSRLRSVRVFHTETRELVTSIELLSPHNKRPGDDGLREYRRKRRDILASHVHLVEVDLLRGGERPGPEMADDPLDTDYVLLVNRFGVERVSGIWPVALNEALPLIPIPLLPPDPDVALDLNAAIREVYAGSRYEQRITYQPPIPYPPVRPSMAAWVEQLLTGQAKPQT